jgi:hypothetical protein
MCGEMDCFHIYLLGEWMDGWIDRLCPAEKDDPVVGIFGACRGSISS